MTNARPLISLVVPCYNIGEYLPEFLPSLARELTRARRRDVAVEVIFVIDGSPDDSAFQIHTWSATRPDDAITVIEQENQGLSGARNTGMAAARGRWISFPDPDDLFGRGYLSTVGAFLSSPEADGVDIVGANIVIFDGGSGAVTNDHPLRWKFAGGRRVVHLDMEPQYVQLQSASSFLRLDLLRDLGLDFDGRVKPAFEDAVTIARMLGQVDDPTLALLPEAKYLYRRRADKSSLVQAGWSKPTKYDDQLRYGYLAILEEAAARGPVPRWMQNTVLYDLAWYFKTDLQVHSETAALSTEQLEVFHDLLSRILGHIDQTTIAEFRLAAMHDDTRAALLSVKGALPAAPIVRLGPVDTDRDLTRVAHYTSPADAPTPLAYTVDGHPVTPVHAKRRSVLFFGRTLATEHIAWLPGTGAVGATLDEQRLTVVDGTRSTALGSYSPNTSTAKALVNAGMMAASLLRHDRARLVHILKNVRPGAFGAVRVGELVTRTSAIDPRFTDCWLLMDRDTEAHDNAEHLYRYLRQHRPDINAWFVLSRKSPDWQRLAAEGFRLVAHGSAAHWRALSQCRELVSTQIDHYVITPPLAIWLRRLPWRFTWLQHGIINYDLSRWLNAKAMSLFVTSTRQERDSIAGDDTPYVFTSKEVVLTGQPRHDALVAKAAAVSDDERRLVVFMPTWRRDLLVDATSGGNARVPVSGFWRTPYVTNWLGLLASPAVRAAAEAAGLELVFMPHPNMAPHLPAERLPAGVRVATYGQDDFQDIVARASHVVTDYSSNGFEVALANRPMMYFQFDRDEFFAGGHIGRRGYFSYEDDGFGPVARTLPEAEAALVSLIKGGKSPIEPYATRIAETFTVRDGLACERIVAAIEEQRRPFTSPDPQRG